MRRHHFIYLIAAAWFVGLYYTRFTLTLAMIATIAAALFEMRGGSIRVRPGLGRALRTFWEHSDFVSVTVPALLVIISLLWSSDWAYWGTRFNIRLPFLLLPVAFYLLPRLRWSQYRIISYLYLGTALFACCYALVLYALDFEAINIRIGQGQSLPTRYSHVRFSLQAAFAAVMSGIFYLEHRPVRYVWERWILGGLAVFFFAFVHVMSVRSGLLVMYACIGLLGAMYVVRRRQWLVGAIALAIMIVLPVVAFHMLPSFKQKVGYALYDYEMYRSNGGAGYSDSQRLMSYQVGWEVFRSAPVIGVGMGDVLYEVNATYDRRYPELRPEARILPHNEYLTHLAGVGVVGTLLFVAAFLWPLLYRKHYRDPVFLALHLIIGLSFLVENTIETAIGTGFYIFFLLMGLHRLQEDKKVAAADTKKREIG